LLQKLITYYVKLCPKMKILALDSSNAENVETNGIFLKNFSSVRHMIFNEDIPMAKKIYLGICEVDTLTLSICADDDLIFPSALDNSIEFLLYNPDYVAVHGLYINFLQMEKSIKIWKEYGDRSNDAAYPGARIFRLFQSYSSLFYAVFRTNDLKEIFSEVKNIETLLFQELYQSCASLIIGKVKRLSIFYGARRVGPPAQNERTKWQTLYWFSDAPPEIFQHYAEYRILLRNLCEKKYFTKKEFSNDFLRICDISHMIYFSKGCDERYLFEQLKSNWAGVEFEHSDQSYIYKKLKQNFENPEFKIKEKAKYNFLNVLNQVCCKLERLIQKNKKTTIGDQYKIKFQFRDLQYILSDDIIPSLDINLIESMLLEIDNYYHT